MSKPGKTENFMETEINSKALPELFRELEIKAEGGDTVAQLELAGLLLKSYKSQNADESQAVCAVAWLRKAAERSNPNAQVRLAGCYMEGLGVCKDPDLAVQWYKMAAHQGNVAAQISLGQYYAGEGVAQDLTEATKWYRIAAEQPSEVARELGEIALEEFYAAHQDLPLPARNSQNHGDADYIKMLTPVERHRLAIARYEEESIGKKGEVARTLEFFRKRDKFINEHPGVTAHDLDFKTFIAENTPNRTEQEWHEIKRRIVAGKAADLEGSRLPVADKDYIKRLVLEQQYCLVIAAQAWRKWGMRREFANMLEFFRKLDQFIAENPNIATEDFAFNQFVEENKPKWDSQFWREVEADMFADATRSLPEPKAAKAIEPQRMLADQDCQQTPNVEHKLERTTTAVSASHTNAEGKRKFTLGRCAVAGIWATILCAFGVGIGGLGLLIAIPLLGLPWLFFEMHDKSDAGEALDVGTGTMILVAGAFLSIFFALPVVVVFALLRAIFRFL